jgi:hypothetical protein
MEGIKTRTKRSFGFDSIKGKIDRTLAAMATAIVTDLSTTGNSIANIILLLEKICTSEIGPEESLYIHVV